MSRFLPADHSQGDERTIGGYAAVHARPAAFEGRDGFSYSVEILADVTGDGVPSHGAFFLFVQWNRFGEQSVAGHLESGFLAFGADAPTAKQALGAMVVEEVQRVLDDLILERDAGGRVADDAPGDEDLG
jgi:hypothetical protein